MQVIQLDNNEQEEIFAIVASLLHLGNVGFTEQDGTSNANITNSYSVGIVSQVCVCTDTGLLFTGLLFIKLVNRFHAVSFIYKNIFKN